MILPGSSSAPLLDAYRNRLAALAAWYGDPANAAAGHIDGTQIKLLQDIDKGPLTDTDTLKDAMATLSTAETVAHAFGFPLPPVEPAAVVNEPAYTSDLRTEAGAAWNKAVDALPSLPRPLGVGLGWWGLGGIGVYILISYAVKPSREAIGEAVREELREASRRQGTRYTTRF